MINIACPKCSSQLALDSSFMGETVECPYCGNHNRVPSHLDHESEFDLEQDFAEEIELGEFVEAHEVDQYEKSNSLNDRLDAVRHEDLLENTELDTHAEEHASIGESQGSLSKQLSGCAVAIVVLFVLAIGVSLWLGAEPKGNSLRQKIGSILKQGGERVSEIAEEASREDTAWLRADNPYWDSLYITEEQHRSLSKRDRVLVYGWEFAWKSLAVVRKQSTGRCVPNHITRLDFEPACDAVLSLSSSSRPWAADAIDSSYQALQNAQIRECGGRGILPNFNTRIIEPVAPSGWR